MKYLLPLLLSGCAWPSNALPGLFHLSPGLSELASVAGPDVWVAHSAGASQAANRLLAGHPPPRALLLVDPWPVDLRIPPGPAEVVVVFGRPTRVRTSSARTRFIPLGGGLAGATLGHIFMCRRDEALSAARALANPPP